MSQNYTPPQTWQDMFLAHKECDTCVPFFKVIDLFYKDHTKDDELYVEATNLNPYLYCTLFFKVNKIKEFAPLIEAQFNHLNWLHQ